MNPTLIARRDPETRLRPRARRVVTVLPGRIRVSPSMRSAPGPVVTFAGVQGGAGVTTAVLLAAGAVTRASDRPAVAIDLATGTRGGLGGLAGTWSQTSAQATAEIVLAGGTLAAPYATTRDGIHVISDPPQAPITEDRIARGLLAATIAGVQRDMSDVELAALARAAAANAELDERTTAAGRGALHKLVRAARGPHSLVAVDLGLADDEYLTLHAALSDLHVWVVAARTEDLDVACRRLLAHDVAMRREVVLAWSPDRARVRSRDLRGLGDARGCPVVRIARFAPGVPWAERERTCGSGLDALCRQLD